MSEYDSQSSYCDTASNMVSDSASEFTNQQSDISSTASSMAQSVSKASVSSKNSIISFLSVHSRAFGQMKNDHWKNRANERGNLNLDDHAIKSEVLNDLKSIMMKHPESV